MKWTQEKRMQQIRQQRREDATGFGEAARLVKAAYEPAGYKPQLSKAQLRQMCDAAAASGVVVTRCPAQIKPPVELRIEPKRHKPR